MLIDPLKTLSDNKESHEGDSTKIEKVSDLDRRTSSDRRVSSSRRSQLEKTDFDNERRNPDCKRRIVKDRREQKIKSLKNNTNREFNYADILTRGHYKVIDLIERFTTNLQLRKFNNLQKHIKDFSNIIRSFSHREELVFYAYFDKLKDQGDDNENVNKMLMVVNLHIYKTGEDILEILNQYENKEMDHSTLKSLVLDLAKINDLLDISLKHKEEVLYSEYRLIPGF